MSNVPLVCNDKDGRGVIASASQAIPPAVSVIAIPSEVEGEAIQFRFIYYYFMFNTYFVYMMTNKLSTVIYTGITNNLIKRVYGHKNKIVPGFSSTYNLCKLVYYEVLTNINDAIRREKQIKGGSRIKKLNLIKKQNPTFKDLYKDLI